jgi:predicted nucleotidyltransferase
MTRKESILKAVRSLKIEISMLDIKNAGLFGSYTRNENYSLAMLSPLADCQTSAH